MSQTDEQLQPDAKNISRVRPREGRLRVNGRHISWRENGMSEVLVEVMPGRFSKFSDLGLSPAEEMEFVNGLLAKQRTYAMPDMNAYFAASAGVTREGHLFVALNNEVHIKDAFEGRGCAETSVLRKAQDGTQDEQVQFKALYLLSGMAKHQPDYALEDKQPGHVACLCGECRQNLRPHTDAGTRFIMLPTNDASKPLAAPQPTPEEGKPWLISYEQMYPVPALLHREAPELAEVVRKGYLFMADSSKKAPGLTAGLPGFRANGMGQVSVDMSVMQELLRAYTQVDYSSPALERDSSPANINRAMVQLMKKAYAEHAAHVPEGKSLKITVVMLKADDGKCYPGVSVEGAGWLPSKPQVMATALNNAGNHIGFSQVYMMTLDTAQIEEEMGAAKGGFSGHRFAAPNPAALGRLIKNLHKGQNPSITLLPVNDGTLTDHDISTLSHTLDARAAFGPGFSNPKSQFTRGGH